MSFLVALAAFVAIITVYATVVTVLVEAMHKLFGLRSAGLNEMLRAFHQKVVPGLLEDEEAPANPSVNTATPNARSFADHLTSGLPSESRKAWYLRSWPLIGRLFIPKRTNMSTLQFIESLATTKEGEALARKYTDRLQDALSVAAYEYERLGETQREYFGARAKGLAVIAGIVVAVFINLDAITLYKELSANSELSSRLTLALDQERLDLVRGTPSTPQSDAEAPLVSPALTQALGDVRTLGVPVGRKMFPHCEGYRFSLATSDTSAETQTAYFDGRCGKSQQATVNLTWAQSFNDYLIEQNATSASSIGRVGHWFGYRINRIMIIGQNPQTFLLWALGILVGGGLLGLGAPFWYGLFSRLTSLAIPGAQRSVGTSPQTGYKRTDGTLKTVSKSIRHDASTDPIDLERGFLTVFGHTNPEAYRAAVSSSVVAPPENAPRGRIISRGALSTDRRQSAEYER